MEGFLMENVRKSSFGAVSYNNSFCGGFGFSNKSAAQYNYSQIHPPPPPINQLLLNTNYDSMRSLIRGGSLFSSAPPPLYSSLPLHRPHRRHHQQQPPLLPLPLKSASLPSPKAAARTKNKGERQEEQQPKPAEPLSIKPPRGSENAVEGGRISEEETRGGSVSDTVSRPRFLLVARRRSSLRCAACFWIIETAVAKGASASLPPPKLRPVRARAGATDDLRKLLRL
ncbi:uncharacterized protein A4U43_C04F21010 [Asparagus officinalis]|uniref:Uncharacterized protein n=1 Tax=Asparagus officinalis TaxID=4686 RepID=A0A5P1F360_ASPOF|nr:uncharacterized protein A4U43_C04F21010 [Asparagus officinalis]